MKYLNKKKLPSTWIVVRTRYIYPGNIKIELQRHPSTKRFAIRYNSKSEYVPYAMEWIFEDSEDALFFKISNSNITR